MTKKIRSVPDFMREHYRGIWETKFKFPWILEMASPDFKVSDDYVDHSVKRPDGTLMSVDVFDYPWPETSVIIAMIEDAMSRPEVFAAFGSVPANGEIEQPHRAIVGLFLSYVEYKYGNKIPDTSGEILWPCRLIANGDLSGTDDPRFIKYCEDQIARRKNIIKRRAASKGQ